MATLKSVKTEDLHPEIQKAMRDLPRYDADHKWITRNWKKLVAEYDGEWVAVYKRRVIAHCEDPKRLIQMLKDLGIQPSSAATKYVTSEEIVYQLFDVAQ